MRFKSLVLAAGVALGLILAAPPTSAFAIEEASCSRDTVNLNQWELGHKCFEGSPGPLRVELEEVVWVDTGKYKVTVIYEKWDGRFHTETLEPRTHFEFDGHVRVYEVRIW